MTIKPHSGEHRTLVVDDHGISRRYVVAMLRQCTGAVKRARTARGALDTALSWYPDLICMDICLPDLGGLEVIRRIRLAWPAEKPQPRVIVLTADESGLKRRDLEGLNVECILVKPVSGDQLRQASGLRRNGNGKGTPCAEPTRELQNLFRAELEERLPELDRYVSNFDRNRTTEILHQLIASSAICNEPRLETGMRALDACCRSDKPPADLARAYYRFLESADDFLSRLATSP